MDDLATLAAGGFIVSTALRWIKGTGWLTKIPDREILPEVHVRALVTLAIAIAAAIFAAWLQGEFNRDGIFVSVTSALSTHSGIFGVTPLGTYVERTVPRMIKRKT